jgi:hypothetical protein
MRKLTTTTALIASLMLFSSALLFSQTDTKKKLERPSKCDVAEVDNYVNKSFDSYTECLKISEIVNVVKVEGEGDNKVLLNANGEPLKKEEALVQLGELLTRTKKQSDNVKAIQQLQKPATESLKKCPPQKKPKATKNMQQGNDALAEVAKETTKQIELIEKQISEVKAMKD